MHGTVRIPRRFCGPPDSGNGGYSAGLLAAYLDGPAEVTLRRPPPLERDLTVEARNGGAVLLDGDAVVAEAVPTDVDLTVPEAIDYATAVEAAHHCPTVVHPEWHPFPTCFVCGTERDPGDGLRVFAGRVGDRELFAAPVVFPADLTASTVPPVLVWAALDCPSSYVMYMDGTRPDAPYVLGRIGARIDELPPAAEPVIAIAWPLGVDGRKLFSGSALLGRDGTRYAVARATWIKL